MCSKIAAMGNRTVEEIVRTKRHTIKNSIIRNFIDSAFCDIVRMSEPRWAEHMQQHP
jgi:hypothetical protein